MYPWIEIGSLKIPSFFLLTSLTAIVCLFWIRYRLTHSNRIFRPWHSLVDPNIAWNLTGLLMVSGLLGGRLFHVLIEYPDHYWRHPIQIFYLGQGGFVFFGGLFVSIIVGMLYVKRSDPERLMNYFDFFAPAVSLAHLLGRGSCLMAGCCYGVISDSWLALFIQDETGHWTSRLPIPLFSSVLEFVNLGIILWAEKGKFKTNLPNGSIFFIWLFLHCLERFFLEFWRDDFRGPHFLISPSAWFSLAGVILSLMWFKKNFKIWQ